MQRSLRRMIGAAIVAIALSAAAAETTQTRRVVLDNARIIDGSGAAPVEKGRIVIEQDRIARVGRAADIDVPAGAETVDLSGRTVIPGLHADLVVVRGQPDRDVSAIRAVDRVMVAGRWVDLAKYGKY